MGIKVTGNSLDPRAEIIAASEVILNGLDSLETVEEPTERMKILADMTVEAGDLFLVGHATVVRGINIAQRKRAMAKTAIEQNGN